MSKIKLHEVTKQFKISNKLAMFYLLNQEIPVKSHSSSVSMEQIEILREFAENQGNYKELIKEFKQSGKKKAAKKATEPEKIKTDEVSQKPEKKPEKMIKEPEKIKSVEEKPKKVVKEPEKIKSPEVKPDKPEIDTTQVGKSKEIKRKPEKSKITPEPVKQVVKPKEIKEVPIKKEPVEKTTVSKPKAKGYVDYKRFGKKQKTQKTANKKIIKRKVNLEEVPDLIQIYEFITLRELTEMLNLRLKDLEEIMQLFDKTNLRNKILEKDEVELICQELNVELDMIPYEDYLFQNSIQKNNAKKEKKIPVVTIMGHVDHGKTTLLDTYRNSRLTSAEAGGITQSIGAYKLISEKGDIVFIDTPGHEAFTNMRARGAQTTDIIILIIAAEDSVMPQTLEAINHAKAAGVPIIVAINKIDLPGANPDKVKQDLSQRDILVEDWGGDTVCVEISAKNNVNLDTLLEMITLVSEMQELKNFKNVLARGRVIEARLDSRTGATATILLEHGKLEIGDHFICGNATGKIKMMFDDNKNTLNKVDSVSPVEMVGFSQIPKSGELFQVVEDIEKAQKIVDLRRNLEKKGESEERFEEKKMTLHNLFNAETKAEASVFSTIIKADNFGSAEVLRSVLKKQEIEDKLEINFVHSGIGNISGSDVMLAATSKSMILGFNVKAPKKILSEAKRENVEIKIYNVIYHLVEDIEKALKGEIKPEYKKEQVGKVEVLKLFKISKLGTIAGCIVREGRVTNKSQINIIRGNDFVFEGTLETLKRIKDEVKEVKAGTECGIKIKNFNGLQEGDIFEVYEMVEQK